MNMRKITLCAASILFLINETSAETSIKSIKILDGDTIQVTHQNSEESLYRLSNIDAPEAPQEGGSRAARNLHKLLNVPTSKIKYKVDFVDRFHRENVTIFVDKKNINLQQVKDGYAWALTKNLVPAFHDAEYAARKFGRGIWSSTNQNPPWEFRSNIK